MYTVLLVGGDGRADCIAEAIGRSSHKNRLYAFSSHHNPGLAAKSHRLTVGSLTDVPTIAEYARLISPDIAIIGPEAPLAAGVVDALAELDIPAVGPTQACAQIESSKASARGLVDDYYIAGNPERYRVFRDLEGVAGYCAELVEDRGGFAVKPDGLTGGKGVRLWQEHFQEIPEAVAYVADVFASGHAAVVIEEKLEGEEFSLQTFCGGGLVHAPPARDHKRASVADYGLNTGGMGSYSCADFCLPFLTQKDVQEAQCINALVIDALEHQFGQEYVGVLYTNFMATREGVKVIEFNCRFADPEVFNALPILETDFLEVCMAMAHKRISRTPVSFAQKATVCKYVVPIGYPDNPVTDGVLTGEFISSDTSRFYFAGVEGHRGRLVMRGSRAVASVGIGDSLEEAERRAENGVWRINGPVRHRNDIGSYLLVERSVERMRRIRNKGVRYRVMREDGNGQTFRVGNREFIQRADADAVVQEFEGNKLHGQNRYWVDEIVD